MSTLTIAEAREHLDELCASVAETGEPVLIQRDGRSVRLVPDGEEKSDPEMLRRMKAAIEGKGDPDEVVEVAFEDLCKALGVDANQLSA